jgi:hypothetical protein
VRVTDLLASSVPCVTGAVTDTSRACVLLLGLLADHGYRQRLDETTVSPGQPMQGETVRMTDLIACSVLCAAVAVTDSSRA